MQHDPQHNQASTQGGAGTSSPGTPARARWVPFMPNSVLVLCATLVVGGGVFTWAVLAKKLPLDGFLSRFSGGGGDPGTHNHLKPSCFWAPGVQGTLRALAAAPLTDASGRLPDMPAMLSGSDDATSCRRDVLEVLTQCALSPAQSVLDPGDHDLRIAGSVGLAPSWSERALSTDEKQAITGCLLERLNAHGHRVPLLLEGENPALHPDAARRARYPHAESSAWGNAFDATTTLASSSPSQPSFAAYVCNERGGGAEPTRVCDQKDNACGLVWVGECSEVEARCAEHPGEGVCSAWKQRVTARLR